MNISRKEIHFVVEMEYRIITGESFNKIRFI